MPVPFLFSSSFNNSTITGDTSIDFSSVNPTISYCWLCIIEAIAWAFALGFFPLGNALLPNLHTFQCANFNEVTEVEPLPPPPVLAFLNPLISKLIGWLFSPVLTFEITNLIVNTPPLLLGFKVFISKLKAEVLYPDAWRSLFWTSDGNVWFNIFPLVNVKLTFLASKLMSSFKENWYSITSEVSPSSILLTLYKIFNVPSTSLGFSSFISTSYKFSSRSNTIKSLFSISEGFFFCASEVNSNLTFSAILLISEIGDVNWKETSFCSEISLDTLCKTRYFIVFSYKHLTLPMK
ncbi:hypothetical protein PR251_02570, partial [Metamycoplasma hyosynoviae]